MILCLLLLAGCDVPPSPDAEPQYPATTRSPHEAVRTGNQDALRWHFQQGADLNELNEEGLHVLHLAIAMERPEMARQLLEWGVAVGVPDPYGSTPLHIAAGQGRVDLARMMIQRGADLAAVDESGYSPVDIAFFMSHDAMVAFLVAAGADDPRGKPKPEADRMVPTHTATDVRAPRDPSSPETGFLVWTSTDHAQTRAAFVGVRDDMVVLRTPDERILRVPIQHLRAEDRETAHRLNQTID